MTNCNTPNAYIINPLFCSDWSDTATNCAAALDALLALDGSRLTDRARAAGLAMLLEPIIGALDGAVGLEGKCITLSPDETERLRELADSHHRGNVRAALDVALSLAEIKAEEPKPELTPEQHRESWQRIADCAASELAKLDAADQGEQEGAA